MKKQTTKPYYEAAHYEHRKNVHGLLVIIAFIAALIMAFSSCTPKHGCYGTKGMSGYGWIKCKETGIVSVLRPDGSIACTYTEPVQD